MDSTSNLDSLTTKVPPTGFGNKSEAVVMTLDEISNQLQRLFDHDDVTSFMEGRARIGHKSITSTELLKVLLYHEVEKMQILKDSNATAVLESQVKKMLQQQIDNIFSIMKMSTKDTSDTHFMLGAIIRSLHDK